MHPGVGVASEKLIPRFEKFLFGAFLLLLLWAPIPLASNRSWALGFLASGLWLVLLITVGYLGWRGESWWRRFGAGAVPLGLIGLFAALLCVQILPLPHSMLDWFAPGGTSAPTLALDTFNTQQYLVATLGYFAGFALSLLLVRGEKRVLILAGAIVAGGILQAWIVILLHASRASYLYFFTWFDQGGRASGTYPNWDHMAGYMEMCLSVGVGLMFARMSGSADSSRPSWRNQAVAFLKFVMSRKMWVRMMLVVMVIALVLSHSRAGNAAFFVSLLVVGGLTMARNPRMRRTAFWLVASLVIVDSVIIGQWVGVDKVVSRLQGTVVSEQERQVRQFSEESLEARTVTARWSLDALRERPWLGFGGGDFYSVFPRFKQSEWYGYFDHTHNDFVEIAVDTGLVGFGLLAVVVLLTLWRVVRLYGLRQPRLNRGMAFGVAMAVSCLMIHSFVDFNLQIPANALTFVVILSLVWVIVPLPDHKKARSLPA
jgi:O-antigen ligase